jgi:hypothetical protein
LPEAGHPPVRAVGRRGASGRSNRVRSRAWDWLFSSTDSISARRGGSMERPTIRGSHRTGSMGAVLHLLGNGWIGGALQGAHPVRLQAVLLPDAPNRAERDAGRRSDHHTMNRLKP